MLTLYGQPYVDKNQWIILGREKFNNSLPQLLRYNDKKIVHIWMWTKGKNCSCTLHHSQKCSMGVFVKEICPVLLMYKQKQNYQIWYFPTALRSDIQILFYYRALSQNNIKIVSGLTKFLKTVAGSSNAISIHDSI